MKTGSEFLEALGFQTASAAAPLPLTQFPCKSEHSARAVL